jgi:hypothetical protein
LTNHKVKKDSESRKIKSKELLLSSKELSLTVTTNQAMTFPMKDQATLRRKTEEERIKIKYKSFQMNTISHKTGPDHS